MNVKTFVENGEWKALCPTCGNSCHVDLISNTIVCSTCYPSLRAMAYQQISGGLLRPVPDVQMRSDARRQAEADGAVYDVTFPAEREQIEQVLRARPTKYNMHWYYENHPTLKRLGKTVETVADLMAENEAHGY